LGGYLAKKFSNRCGSGAAAAGVAMANTPAIVHCTEVGFGEEYAIKSGVRRGICQSNVLAQAARGDTKTRA